MWDEAFFVSPSQLPLSDCFIYIWYIHLLLLHIVKWSFLPRKTVSVGRAQTKLTWQLESTFSVSLQTLLLKPINPYWSSCDVYLEASSFCCSRILCWVSQVAFSSSCCRRFSSSSLCWASKFFFICSWRRWSCKDGRGSRRLTGLWWKHRINIELKRQ